MFRALGTHRFTHIGMLVRADISMRVHRAWQAARVTMRYYRRRWNETPRRRVQLLGWRDVLLRGRRGWLADPAG